jgi:DNA-binding NarL/FixJ family response regulator
MRAIESCCILLVDDHAAVRQRLALVLTEEGLGECREAAEREEAFSSASSERPDLALVGLAPGTGDVLELVSDLCARNIPVLVSSMHEGALHVHRAPAATSRGARP